MPRAKLSDEDKKKAYKKFMFNTLGIEKPLVRKVRNVETDEVIGLICGEIKPKFTRVRCQTRAYKKSTKLRKKRVSKKVVKESDE